MKITNNEIKKLEKEKQKITKKILVVLQREEISKEILRLKELQAQIRTKKEEEILLEKDINSFTFEEILDFSRKVYKECYNIDIQKIEIEMLLLAFIVTIEK